MKLVKLGMLATMIATFIIGAVNVNADARWHGDRFWGHNDNGLHLGWRNHNRGWYGYNNGFNNWRAYRNWDNWRAYRNNRYYAHRYRGWY